MAACQPLISVDVDPRVEWLAVVMLDRDEAIVGATGILPVAAELPRQSNEGSTLVFGFASDQFDPREPNLSEPVRLAEPCDPGPDPIWMAERTGDRYREVEAARRVTA